MKQKTSPNKKSTEIQNGHNKENNNNFLESSSNNSI